MRGTTHVLLHQQHTGGGLQIQATRVKADSFSNKSQHGMRLFSPTHANETRRPVGCPADRVYGRIILREQIIALDNFDLGVKLVCMCNRYIGQVFRSHVFGRRVDQVPNQRLGIEQVLYVLRHVTLEAQNRLRLVFADIPLKPVCGKAPPQAGLDSVVAAPY